MKDIYWTRIEEREDADALVLFRRRIVTTSRGQALEDVPVLVVEHEGVGKIVDIEDAHQLELDVHQDEDGSIAISGRLKQTTTKPKDPVVKKTKFDDPQSDRSKKSKTARGMGRFLDKPSKPAGSPGSPPVPPEQRGGRGGRPTSLRSSRRKKTGVKK